jgi:lipopolysaccharide export system protein LptA
MRFTVARLRRSIVVLAVLLIAVLAGFFFYARYRFRHFERDLPGRLGVNIQQTANGFTYSQSSQGHTLFTIHASKLIQYKEGGQARLHDVAITLYGPPGSNRTDKISGADFDYNQQTGIAVATGDVQIELAGLGDDGNAQQNQIHVTTSGLTFNQKTGDATTDQHTEFVLPKASGNSQGAQYNSKTGVLVLDNQVEITSDNNGKTAVVHATHAQMLRDSQQAFLLNPTGDYNGEKSSSDQAIVYFRKDGSARTIDSQGHVRLVTNKGAVITASTSQTQLDAHSQPTQVDMGGGVNFVSNQENESMHGNAVSGTLTFGAKGALKHAQFRDAVSFLDQVLKLANDPKGTASRQVQASQLDVDFAADPATKKSVAQKALAAGNASVNLHTIPSKGPQELTNVAGDQLLFTLAPDGREIRQLDGAGHTRVTSLGKDGSTSTSTGDRLHITFPPESGAAGQKPVIRQTKNAAAPGNKAAPGSQIESAIQDGHVVLTQIPQPQPGKPQPATMRGWADHAEYHSADQIMHLTGNPRIDDGQSLQMAATLIDYHRDSGDATAQGNVKAIDTQAKTPGASAPQAPGASAPASPGIGGSGPVHITADHAQVHRATNISIFYGSPKTPARMWQDANSVAAPVLELAKTPESLKAYGDAAGAAPVVSANLTSASGPKHQQNVVRVQSRTLLYSDSERRADFRGSVTAEDSDGTIRGDEAQVYLTPALTPAQKKPKSGPSQTQGQSSGNQSSQNQPSGNQSSESQSNQNQSSQVERIVTTGHVSIVQPGRRGTGEQLVYTTTDGRYVLMGTPANPPHMYDQAKGTTTGAELIFNSQDDSVVVSGGKASAVTETRTPK